MNKIKNIDIIFKKLNKEMKKFDKPILSALEKAGIKKTPFTTLISCILSLRTKDEVTEKASVKLFNKYNTVEKLSNADIKDIQNLIYPVGFYKVKSKRLKQISNKIIENYNGEVPNDFEALLELKGVGRKTANIVMVYGFNNKEFIPIDTHCHRIPNRLGWMHTKTPEETEFKIKEILPKKYWYDFNHLFVKFGQTICLPVSPLCSKCPINKNCKKIGVKKHR